MRRRRVILFRLFAVLLALVPFLVVEVALRAYGFGQPELDADPFVGFTAVHPLFELSESGDRYETGRTRRTHFVADSFLARKPPGELRVFCLGDSTVQGNPWSVETSFTTWLEISLNAADPGQRWDVINCGGVSYASYRMVPIFEELLRYQPDLIVVHCSHNEFLEDRTYRTLKRTASFLGRTQAAIAELRLRMAVRRGLQSVRGRFDAWRSGRMDDEPVHQTAREGQPILPAEVEALLDYRGGLEFYHHDADWRRDVIAHYEFNLRRMVTLAKRAGVTCILLNPGCQLRDCPPFKAEHRRQLADGERQRWDALWDEARTLYSSHPRQAADILREALAIDDQHAGMHYDLAQCHDGMGLFAEARAEFLQAKELDVCPLRILQSMNEIVLEVGRETRTPVVDVRALFDRLSRNGIPGSDWFADHVHPTIPGYQRIADEIAGEVVRLGRLRPQPGWQDRARSGYESHLNSLPTIYFLRGQQRLDSLMLWAQGRVTRERPAGNRAPPTTQEDSAGVRG
jgi:hypothetical protein